jgi:hypothetical protein
MEEDGHVYFLALDEREAAGYVSAPASEDDDLFHLPQIYVLPCSRGAPRGCFLLREAFTYISTVRPGPCLMDSSVNPWHPRRCGSSNIWHCVYSVTGIPDWNAGSYLNDSFM